MFAGHGVHIGEQLFLQAHGSARHMGAGSKTQNATLQTRFAVLTETAYDSVFVKGVQRSGHDLRDSDVAQPVIALSSPIVLRLRLLLGV